MSLAIWQVKIHVSQLTNGLILNWILHSKEFCGKIQNILLKLDVIWCDMANCEQALHFCNICSISIPQTLQKTKSFSSTDWWRKFDIHFVGEYGIDGGGLTREWMNQVLNELFHSKGALFRKFNDQDSQGLVRDLQLFHILLF